jgi:N-acetylglucosaminyl-diphospho-decaprenol L-rhamnosyltransferase
VVSGPALPVATVVVVTHNSSGSILGWLGAVEALSSGTEAPRLETCVVDNGSRPDELAFLRQHVGPRVDVLVESSNVGFGRGCNAGAAATRAPVLIFTNPDTRVRSLPDDVASNRPIDGTVLAAMGMEADGSLVPLAFEHLPTFRWEARSLLLGGFIEVYARTAVEPAWALGAALVMARTDFEAVGGFYDKIFLFFEDADICASHVARGGHVRVDPSFVVEHEGSTSTSNTSLELDTISRESGRIFAARHGSGWHAAALYCLLVVWYMPRRVAMTLLRRALGRPASPSIRRLVLSLLFPSVVRRRLGVA